MSFSYIWTSTLTLEEDNYQWHCTLLNIESHCSCCYFPQMIHHYIQRQIQVETASHKLGIMAHITPYSCRCTMESGAYKRVWQIMCSLFISSPNICAVSVVMFSTFEHSVDFLYRKVMQMKKEDCTKAQQLGVTCLAGYAAGSVGSIVSNPADNIVASVNNKKANSLKQVISTYVVSLYKI